MYIDSLTEKKITAFYILLNGKSQNLYKVVFESVFNIISNNKEFDINYEAIITDNETALRNILKIYFPTSMHISCYFHYQQDLLRNIRIYGLYKKELKDVADKALYLLAVLPLEYNRDIDTVKKKLNNITKKFPLFSNYINNYFMEKKLKDFEDNSLYYKKITKECRTNNFLENYNGYIKSCLGKRRTVNWVNFCIL